MFVAKCFFAVLILDLANFAAVFAQLAEDDVIQTSTRTNGTMVVLEKSRRPASVRPSETMCSRYAHQVQSGNNGLCASKLKLPINGGRAEAAPREFPHMAAIGYDSSGEVMQWWCVGSLISENFVLTTAHCLRTTNGEAKWVRVGDLKLSDIANQDARPQVRRVAEIIKYPQYRPPLKYNDIGLLKLDIPVTFDEYVKPACLSVVPVFADGHKAVDVAWALDYDDGRSYYEMWKNDISMISFAQCNSFYHASKQLPNGIDHYSQLCGLHLDKSCQEDFGSTLIADNTEEECMYDIIGISSFGTGCSKLVYTKINYYVSWIESIVWPHLR